MFMMLANNNIEMGAGKDYYIGELPLIIRLTGTLA
jgi:hypothetical protein